MIVEKSKLERLSHLVVVKRFVLSITVRPESQITASGICLHMRTCPWVASYPTKLFAPPLFDVDNRFTSTKQRCVTQIRQSVYVWPCAFPRGLHIEHTTATIAPFTNGVVCFVLFCFFSFYFYPPFVYADLHLQPHPRERRSLPSLPMMHLLLRGLALVAVILFSASVPAAASVPTHGPYKVESNIFNVSSLDSSDPSIVMVYPNNAPANATFPLLAYAHGAAGGGWYENQTPPIHFVFW